ncbi:hypothetical protein OG298_24305 [Streptomyces sp. NBC_01005]|uniref:hypothetical protein n=1 Tax=unclassified Streptomyces TaxID=2593676 RepID=UPI002E309FF7|nr:hypothetical protein [Streptomyces sp. NBC_01362]WSW07238.1 hypothetical protein OG298_24305 [Streptomyces sp. NBC_01005]WTC96747.1 hypothetical protein OH736_24320 [Streptomyces sp. NBC_01650]
MPTRTFAVAAAVVGTAVLATGITYASNDGSTRAEPAATRAEQPAHRAAQPPAPARQAAPAPAPLGSESGTENKEDEGGGGGDHESSDRGGGDDEGGGRGGRDDEGGGRGGRDDEGGGRGGRGGYDRKEERIYFNERSYDARSEGCITAASGLGSNSFNVYNNSRKFVEVYRGFACDGGSPVATVGPYGSTNGVAARTVQSGGFFDNGVVGSFRVIGYDEEW